MAKRGSSFSTGAARRAVCPSPSRYAKKKELPEGRALQSRRQAFVLPR